MMRKLKYIAIIALLATTSNAEAQLSGNGYYRAKNVGSGRYITIIDNQGKIDAAATDIDFGALLTIRHFKNVESNPGSIIYIRKEDGLNQFSLCSQGTDTQKITGERITLQKVGDNKYNAFGTRSGLTIYMNDVKKLKDEEKDTSYISNNAKKTDPYCQWQIIPVKIDIDEQYFGIAPEIEYNGKYYATIYAYFPFKVTEGMKAYTITTKGNQAAIYNEITGTVPISTPVLIECSSPTAEGNRIDIVDEEVPVITNNQLVGIWFCNHNDGHINRKEYSSYTMRVLGLKNDGKLGFIKATSNYLSYNNGKYYLPANKAYLPVCSSAKSEMELMTEEEYEKYIVGINTLESDEYENNNIYTLSGSMIRKHSNNTEGLPKGVYIINKKKIIVH